MVSPRYDREDPPGAPETEAMCPGYERGRVGVAVSAADHGIFDAAVAPEKNGVGSDRSRAR